MTFSLVSQSSPNQAHDTPYTRPHGLSRTGVSELRSVSVTGYLRVVLLCAGRWRSYLEHALTLKPSYSGATNGGSVVTDIVAKVALGLYSGSGEASGKVRAFHKSTRSSHSSSKQGGTLEDPRTAPSVYTPKPQLPLPPDPESEPVVAGSEPAADTNHV